MRKVKIVTLVALAVAAVICVGAGTKAVAGMHPGAGHFLKACARMSCAHGHLEELLDQLDLRDDQQQHVDNIHALIERRHSGWADAHQEELAALRDSIATGQVDEARVQQKIDEHLQGVREAAYEISRELVALYNTLDQQQRDVLVAHLDAAQQRMQDQHAACDGRH